MNIAITGPQKYDFQDLVCAEVMLQFADAPSARFFVEPEGGEDGELHVNGKTFEIQVKGASGSVTLVELAEYLTHFPSRKSSNTLLERVLASENHYAIFVLSGRCDDTTSALVEPKFPTSSAPLARAKSIAKALIGRLRSAASSDRDASALAKNREQHLSDLAKTLEASHIRNALSRVFLLERVDEFTLEDRFARALTEKHAVPLDRIPDAINRCREIVKAAKGGARDALPDFRATVEKFKNGSVMPRNYVARGAEEAWAERLAKSSALLVTGRPRTGKTDAARAVAAGFQTTGYDLLTTADIGTAERYLEDPRPSLRLAVLDDPLGGAYSEPDAGRILQKLSKLIQRLAPDRKIIVAQSQEQLLVAAMMPSVAQIRTGGLEWLELSDGEPAFLESIWAAEAERSDVPKELRELVSASLIKGELVLGPGSVSHLASNHTKLKAPYTLAAAEALARQDSTDIGAAWKAEGLQPLARALAIGSTPFEDIAPRELAFILGSGGASLPGKPDIQHMVISYGGDEEHNPPDPTYEFDPTLSFEQSSQCDLLEQRSVIRWNAERLGFSHPIYRAAAQFASGGYTQQQARLIIDSFRRTIFSGSATTARAAARNVEWLFDRLQGREEQAELVECVEEALTCFYPSVRDACFQFMLGHFDQLGAEFQSRLSIWVDNVTRVEMSSLEWREGEARLPLGKSVGLKSFTMEMVGLADTEVASERAILEGADGGYLSAEGAVRALMFYRQNPAVLTEIAIGRLLSYAEGFIRAEAAGVWLASDRQNDSQILDRIARDEHPRVAADVLDGAVRGWKHMPEGRRETIIGVVQTLAKLPSCAAAMMPNLVRFSRVEYTGDNPPWKLFGAVMPSALRSAPVGALVSEPRLHGVIRDAVPHLQTDVIVGICDAWTDWLEGELRKGNFRGEYAAGVPDILVPATRRSPNIRAGRLRRLVNLPGSSTVHSVLIDLLYYWDHLTPDEKALATELISVDRPDKVWLRAAVLTAAEVPPDLERLILGPELKLDAGAEALIADMPSELLDACVYAYTGWIGRLWNKAHNGEAVWAPVIKILCTRPDHRLFRAAWFETTLAGDGSPVAEAIKVMGPGCADRILTSLIADKVDRTGDFMPEAWKALLDFAPDQPTRDSWLARTIPFLPAILEDLRDLANWLPVEDHSFILNALKADTTALQIAQAVKVTNLGPQVLNVLKVALDQDLPRIHGTYSRLQTILWEFEKHDEDFFEWLNEKRIGTLDVGRQIREELRSRPPEAEGWIEP